MRDTHEPERRGLGAILVLGVVIAVLGLAIGGQAQPAELPSTPEVGSPQEPPQDPPRGPVGAHPPGQDPPGRPPDAGSPRGGPPRKGPPRGGPRGDRGPRGKVEKRLAAEWLKKSAEQRLALAGQFCKAKPQTSRRFARTRFTPLFRSTLHWVPRDDYDRYLRASPAERPAALVKLVNRHAQSIRDNRYRHGLVETLDRMQKAELITGDESKQLLSISDSHRRRSAYAALRDTVFLRQLKKAGRIDAATLERLSSEQNATARRRGVNALRRSAFRSVNAHLIHFMLSPVEQVKLRETRLASSFSKRLHRLEAQHEFRFLSIFPSDKPDPLSDAIRMSREHEAKLSREGATPSERKEAALQVFREQKAAFAHVLSARFGPVTARRFLETGDPQKFYVRAFRMIRRFDPGQRRGADGPGRRRRGPGAAEEPRVGPGGRPGPQPRPGVGPRPGVRPGPKPRPGVGPRPGSKPRPGIGPRRAPGPRKAPKRGGNQSRSRNIRSMGGRGR